ncbi:DNA cross-link repair 1A protein isoform X2 [Eurosta solidaginis]|uniref:DNA cross-link repair 1A protein isoform X2 n=1 Tax=Eurosta solidaginis TaxID=178769 RepID=UPI00353061B8
MQPKIRIICTLTTILKELLITPRPSTRKRTKQNLTRKAATTTRKKTIREVNETDDTLLTVNSTTNARTTAKKNFTRSKEPPPSQLRIDTFFKSCTKSYKIEPPSTSIKDEKVSLKTNKKSKSTRKSTATRRTKSSVIVRKGRKRLFNVDDESSTTTVSSISGFGDMTPPRQHSNRKRASNAKIAHPAKLNPSLEDIEQLINLCSDDELEAEVERENHVVGMDPQLPAVVVKNEESRIIRKQFQANQHFIPIPSTSSFSANIKAEISAMVTIPVIQKSSVNVIAKSKCKKDVTKSIKKNLLKTTTPVLRESSERLRNESNIQIKVEPDFIEFGALVSQSSSIEKETLQTNRIKVERDTEIKCNSPPTPPQTSTDTNSSNSKHISCSNTRSASTADIPKVAQQPSPSTEGTSTKGGRVKKVRICPPYKTVAGTTFAVDAFQYGQIAGVTHYFLTHFHADHYQGLTRKFAMPLYVSPLTARLVRALIPVEDQYLHEIELNQPIKINDVEVTAIDANHCPGAVLFVFKLSTGRCILHTGDFRASPEMESEPIFWNNNVDTIYLDTTYIAHKHNFCTQFESIDRAKEIIRELQNNRPDVRILYVCGSYVIGKERFWTSLAHEFELKVWTEKNRLKALRAMELEEVRGLLCDDPYKAQMHVIPIGKVSYHSLVEYFRPFETHFDIVLAFRPSGWEKNTKPALRSQINVVGIEYSEHSSHAELERFVTYLKPREVISTVPVMQGNPYITPKIPDKWYKYDSLKSRKRNFQPSITSFMKMRPRLLGHSTTKRTTSCVTPTKTPDGRRHELSQLSVRAMATCNELQCDDDDIADLDMPATSSKTEGAVITLFPDLDASDDWIS